MRRFLCTIAFLAAAFPAFALEERVIAAVEETAPAPTPEQKEPLPLEAQKAARDGLNAFDKGDLATARKNFQKMLQLVPDNMFALVNLGLVEYRLKAMDDAEKHLKRAVRLQPDTVAAWLTLGVMYCDEGKLDAALAALSQAVLLDPKNPRAHNYLGVTVGKKGWYSGAEAELQKALELDSQYAEANFNLALFYLQRDPPAVELARRHYQRALELGAAPDPLVEKSLGESKK
jgi:Flp pilus assembly protein TadD